MKKVHIKILLIGILSLSSISYGWNKEYEDAMNAVIAGTATHEQKQLLRQKQKQQNKNDYLSPPSLIPIDSRKARTSIEPAKTTTSRTTISSLSDQHHQTANSYNKHQQQKKKRNYKNIESQNASGTLFQGAVDPSGLKNDVLQARADATSKGGSKVSPTKTTVDSAPTTDVSSGGTTKPSKSKQDYLKRTNTNNKNYGKGKGQKHYKGNKHPNGQRKKSGKGKTRGASKVKPAANESLMTKKNAAKAFQTYTDAANIADTGRDIRKLVKGEKTASKAFKDTADRLLDGGVVAVETLYTKGDDLIGTMKSQRVAQDGNVKERAHQVGLELSKNGVSKKERQEIMKAMWNGDDSLLNNKIQELKKQNITINVPELKQEKIAPPEPYGMPGFINQNIAGVEGDDTLDERIIDTALGMGKGLYEGGKSIIMLAVETGDEIGNIAGEHIYTKGRNIATDITEIKNIFQQDKIRQNLIDKGANPEDVDAALEKFNKNADRSGLIDIQYELAAAQKAAQEAADKKAADEAANKEKQKNADNNIANTNNDNKPPAGGDDTIDEPNKPDNDNTVDDNTASSGDKKNKTDSSTDGDDNDEPNKPDNDNTTDDNVASSGDKKNKTNSTTDGDDNDEPNKPDNDNTTDDNVASSDVKNNNPESTTDQDSIDEPNKPDNDNTVDDNIASSGEESNGKKKPETSTDKSILALQDAEGGTDSSDNDGFNDDDFSEDQPDPGEVFTDKTNQANQKNSKNAQDLHKSITEIADASTAGNKTILNSKNVVNDANVNAQHTVNVAMNKSNADYNENSFGNKLNTEIADGIKSGFETAGTAIGTAIGDAAVRHSIHNNKHDDHHVTRPPQNNTTRKPPSKNKSNKPPTRTSRPPNRSSSIAVTSGNKWPVCPICGRRHKPNRQSKPPNRTTGTRVISIMTP